jgi:hypothetical protein
MTTFLWSCQCIRTPLDLKRPCNDFGLCISSYAVLILIIIIVVLEFVLHSLLSCTIASPRCKLLPRRILSTVECTRLLCRTAVGTQHHHLSRVSTVTVSSSHSRPSPPSAPGSLEHPLSPTLKEMDAKRSRLDVSKRSVSSPWGGRHTPVYSFASIAYTQRVSESLRC